MENKKITTEEIRKQKGLEDLTDKEANEAADTIDKLCYLLIKILKKEHIKNIESKKKPKQKKI
jgi:hypothetical protein